MVQYSVAEIRFERRLTDHALMRRSPRAALKKYVPSMLASAWSSVGLTHGTHRRRNTSLAWPVNVWKYITNQFRTETIYRNTFCLLYLEQFPFFKIPQLYGSSCSQYVFLGVTQRNRVNTRLVCGPLTATRKVSRIFKISGISMNVSGFYHCNWLIDGRLCNIPLNRATIFGATEQLGSIFVPTKVVHLSGMTFRLKKTFKSWENIPA